MPHVIIAVENLRIGGYQRLALDQSYSLADKGISVLLLLLNPTDSGLRSFEIAESPLIIQKRIDIRRLSGNRLKDLYHLRRLMREFDSPLLVLSHSLRASVLFSFGKLGSRHKISIHTTIHQLPALSAPYQRFKRFIYAQFTDKLFGYSVAVCHDWEDCYWKLGKPIILLRNGIYLPRLVTNTVFPKFARNTSRLIYLGRITGWKGVDVYLSLFKKPQFAQYGGLMMISEKSPEIEREIDRIGKRRIDLKVGANLSEYVPRPGDLHVYATNYGNKSKFSESISLNCLEMAAIGVRSLVSKSNCNTWPELTGSNIFIESEWDQIETFDLSAHGNPLPGELLQNIQEIVSIENNLNEHLKLWEIK